MVLGYSLNAHITIQDEFNFFLSERNVLAGLTHRQGLGLTGFYWR